MKIYAIKMITEIMEEDATRLIFLEPDFLEEMNSYRLTRTFTDIEFICKNGSVLGHVGLLATRSGLLNLVTAPFQHGHHAQEVLLLPDFDVEIVGSLIQLLYLGETRATGGGSYVQEINSLIANLDMNIGSIDISKLSGNKLNDKNTNYCPEEKMGCSKCPNVHFTHRQGMLRHHQLYHGEVEDSFREQLVQVKELCEIIEEGPRDKTAENEGIGCHDESCDDDKNYVKENNMKQKRLGTCDNNLDKLALNETAESMEVKNSLANVYNEHLVEFNKSIQDSISCRLCSDVVKKSGLSNHFHKKHPDHIIFPAEGLPCELNFGASKRIKMKGKAEEVSRCITCNKDIKRNYVKQHYNYHLKKKDYKCKHCEKEFVSQSNLTEHCSRHHGKNCRGVCPICGKMFKLDSDLKKHLDIQHEPEKYTCNICQRKFRIKLNYNDHLRTHSGEKPFFCDVCGKSFGRKATLNVHIRIHTGEKRYKCSVCNLSFINSSHRLRHRREVHLGIKRQTLEYKELSDANQANNYTGKRMEVKFRKNRRNYRKLTGTDNLPLQNERQLNTLKLPSPKGKDELSEKKTTVIRMNLKGNSNKINSFSVLNSVETPLDSTGDEVIKLENKNIDCKKESLNELKVSKISDTTLNHWDFVILGEEEVETA